MHGKPIDLCFLCENNPRQKHETALVERQSRLHQENYINIQTSAVGQQVHSTESTVNKVEVQH